MVFAGGNFESGSGDRGSGFAGEKCRERAKRGKTTLMKKERTAIGNGSDAKEDEATS
jgi:hypothetical protein